MQNKQEWGFTVPSLNCVDIPRIISEALEADENVQVVFVSNEKTGQGFCLTSLANAVASGLSYDEIGFIVEATTACEHPYLGFGAGPTYVRLYPNQPVPEDVLHVDGRPWVCTTGASLDRLVRKTPVRIQLF